MRDFKQLEFREYKGFYLDALASLGAKSEDIKIHDRDIECRCPVCGDSRKGNKRRLHLYQKGEVINVNCFNGDCRVKNYTPYRFFKEFTPSIFQQFQNFYRKRYLLEVSGTSKPKVELLGIEGDETLFDVVGITASYKEQILELIENFQLTGVDSIDLGSFKLLVKKIKELDTNGVAVREFREMMKV